jgi:hypothetical protein
MGYFSKMMLQIQGRFELLKGSNHNSSLSVENVIAPENICIRRKA